MTKKRIAIVSSYNEACGNASYTNVLAQEIGAHADVEIIPLNLFLLQSNFKSLRKAADDYVDEISSYLSEFDGVNFQFEGALYGPDMKTAVKRVLKMIGSCKAALVTMHRIEYQDNNFVYIAKSFVSAIKKRSVRNFYHSIKEGFRSNEYSKLIRSIIALNKEKNVGIMVHTKRDADLLKYVFKAENFKDYPITFLNKEKRAQYLASNKDLFKEKHSINTNQKTVGIFGFISEYKGHDTFLKALENLPQNYIGLIFGTQHPQSVMQNVKIDKFLEELIDIIENDSEKALKQSMVGAVSLAKPVSDCINPSLKERIRFCGNLDDNLFIEAIVCCDAVVLPYLETGQSMSGVVSLALETKSNCFLTNNPSFNGLRRYYGDSFHSFDIGNYLDLAQKIMYSENSKFTAQLDLSYEKYNIENNAKLHYEMLTKE